MVFTPNSPTPTRRSLERETSFLPLATTQTNKSIRVIDGPPYANGPIHIGHALNKITKDITARYHGTTIRPAWDCHGLPIEWMVEKKWRERGLDKNADRDGFLADCEAHAREAVELQTAQFIGLGVAARWDKPVLTVDSRKKIMKRFHKMVRYYTDPVYLAEKPTPWSPAEQTALAGAEMEEKTIQTKSAYVAFSLGQGAIPLLVWTTSPWSLVGNAGVAFNPNLTYGVYTIDGKPYVMADDCPLADRYRDQYSHRYLMSEDIPAHHPITGEEVPVMAAGFVTSSKGTGLVHVGPAHSEDDWRLWMAEFPNTPYPNLVNSGGFYADDAPAPFAGTKVTGYVGANTLMIEYLAARRSLVLAEDQSLDIPVSWRSGCPLVIRPTRQVFIKLENTAVAGSSFEFTTESAKARFSAMLATRKGDWLVSRQRLWGTPMGLFVRNGELVKEKRVLRQTRQYIDQHGFGAWLDNPRASLPSEIPDPETYEAITDVLDVWFDSGAIGLGMMHDSKTNILIEGSDQSRGWFQSLALINSIDSTWYDNITVMTHGFVVDKKGRKMSKSEGNGISPDDVIARYGPDALRVWVASTDINDDIRLSDDIMKTHAETARKLRVYLRFMAGCVADTNMDVHNMGAKDDLELIDTVALSLFETFMNGTKPLIQHFRYPKLMSEINTFMGNVLSGFWFEARKDVIYCDDLQSPNRQAILRLMKYMLCKLTDLIEPIMPFLIEELRRDNPTSFELYQGDRNTDLGILRNRFNAANTELAEIFMGIRDKVMKDIEGLRKSGAVKKAAECRLRSNDPLFAQIAIAAGCSENVVTDDDFGEDEYVVEKSPDARCDRCWRHHSTTDDGQCERALLRSN